MVVKIIVMIFVSLFAISSDLLAAPVYGNYMLHMSGVFMKIHFDIQDLTQ